MITMSMWGRNLNFVAMLLLAVNSVDELYAGDKKHGKSQEEELKHEISYLAKKLLDMSGEETITVSQEPVTKPFLGICSSVTPGGVKLTCITPGYNAAAAGLRTGDLVIDISGTSLISPKKKNVEKAYYDVIKSMQTGDVLEFMVYRGQEEQTIKVNVGEINHPGYVMTIRRK